MTTNSFFVAASAQLATVRGPAKEVLTQPFLDTCRLVLPIIGESLLPQLLPCGWIGCD
jgi:hypothetical protein